MSAAKAIGRYRTEEYRAWARARYAANPEKQAAASRKWVAKNREHVRAHGREWRIANREHLAAYRLANREKLAAVRKAWRLANREKILKRERTYKKAYKTAHPPTKEEREWRAKAERDRRARFPEKVREQARAWAKKNPGKYAAIRRDWKKRNPSKVKVWQKRWIAANREKVNAAQGRYARRDRAAKRAAVAYILAAPPARRLARCEEVSSTILTNPKWKETTWLKPKSSLSTKRQRTPSSAPTRTQSGAHRKR